MSSRAAIALALLHLALLGLGILAGIPVRDAAVMTALLPAMALIPLGLRLADERLVRFACLLYGIWFASWLAGFVVIAGLRMRYNLGPMDERVVQALAGTDAREAREYVRELAPMLAGLALLSGSAGAGAARLTARMLRIAREQSRRARVLLAPLLVAIPLLLHLNPVVKRSDPLTLLDDIRTDVRGYMADIALLRSNRGEALGKVKAWQPAYHGPARRLVVLIIGESSNRADWSLYGYERQTNPRLQAIADELVVFRDVISSYGATAVELPRMLTLADREDDHDWRRQPSVINLARAAGYRTWWITNQSFILAMAAFGMDCDRLVSVYAGRYGRHDTSLDSKLLDPLTEALADPAPRKFIVLHMLGSHPDYAQRYPPDFDIFGQKPDAISRQMATRWFGLQRKRDEYDNSILFSDWVIASVIEKVRKSASADATVFYLSDHAQDVGHYTSAWGHQFHYESGFTIPALLWKKGQQPDRRLEGRPYQSDRFDATLLSLLDIGTAHDRPGDDLAGPHFVPRQRKIDGIDYVPGVSNVPPP